MTSTFLVFLDFAMTVTACIVTLFLAIPAYKRTKQLGFMLWSIASLISLWNIITLQTIGSNPRSNPAGYVFIHHSYRILFVVDSVIGLIGTVMIIKSYLLLFESRSRETSPPPATPQ